LSDFEEQPSERAKGGFSEKWNIKTEEKTDFKIKKTFENEGEKQTPLVISRNLIKPAESAPTSHINQVSSKLSNPFIKPTTLNEVPHVTTTNETHTTTTSSGGNGNISNMIGNACILMNQQSS